MMSRKSEKVIKALGKNTTKKGGFLDRFEDTFRAQDVFGGEVHFTYKGKKTYQTNIGALVSIIVRVIMLAFISYEFYMIFARVEPMVGIKTSIELDGELKPAERGFDVAFAVM